MHVTHVARDVGRPTNIDKIDMYQDLDPRKKLYRNSTLFKYCVEMGFPIEHSLLHRLSCRRDTIVDDLGPKMKQKWFGTDFNETKMVVSRIVSQILS